MGKVTTHYTAVLEVKQVREDDGTGRGDDKRFVDDSAKVVVRAETMEELKTKLAGHINLL